MDGKGQGMGDLDQMKRRARAVLEAGGSGTWNGYLVLDTIQVSLCCMVSPLESLDMPPFSPAKESPVLSPQGYSHAEKAHYPLPPFSVYMCVWVDLKILKGKGK